MEKFFKLKLLKQVGEQQFSVKGPVIGESNIYDTDGDSSKVAKFSIEELL